MQYPDGHFLPLVPNEVKNPPEPKAEVKQVGDTNKPSVKKQNSNKRGGHQTFILRFLKNLVYIFLLMLILTASLVIIFKKNKKRKKKLVRSSSIEAPRGTFTYPSSTPQSANRPSAPRAATPPVTAPPVTTSRASCVPEQFVEPESGMPPSDTSTVPPITSGTQPTAQPVLSTGEDCVVPVQYKNFAEDADEWIIVGASVQGNGHVSTNLPCQDSSGYRYLGNGWGIAITSDGAGSKTHSHIGSAIAVQCGLDHFEALVKGIGWMTNNELPSETEWDKHAYFTLKAVHDDTEAFAKQKGVDFDSLSATIIVIIHSPKGLLVCHIGDGRAGYRDATGHWHPAITPHGGEECNQTIFIPMEFWDKRYYEQSGVGVPEARVIVGPVTAFTLMSDGCEKTAYQCDVMNPGTGMHYDPNQPHEAFFEPVIRTLRSNRENGDALDERKASWAKFLYNGIDKLAIETDDKTMIVATVAP